MNDNTRNIFLRGAESGIPFGIYLSIASIATVFGDRMEFLSLLSMCMILFIPILVYRFQRRQYVASEMQATHSELWIHGIIMNIGGAAICALVTYAVIDIFRPNYVAEMMNQSLEIMKSDPILRGTEVVKALDKAMDNNYYPRVIELVMQMFWLTSFLGSIGSAVTALIARRNRK